MAKMDPAVDKELKAIKKRLDNMDAKFKKVKDAINDNNQRLNTHAKTINELHGLDKKSFTDTVKKAVEDAKKAAEDAIKAMKK